jgi:phosphoribosylanthranilate isomerase
MSAKVKVCGLRNVQNSLEALESGAEYLGYIIESKNSPRSITIHEFARIIEEVKSNQNLNAEYKIVAVIQDLPDFKIQKIVDLKIVDILQFHGQEAPSILSKFYFQMEVWKALETDSFSTQEGLNKLRLLKNLAHRFVLDVSKTSGNSFQSFEFYKLAENFGFELVVAGGLNYDNVENVFNQIDPEIIDISSGVEVSVGQKSFQKMQDFISKVKKLSRF